MAGALRAAAVPTPYVAVRGFNSMRVWVGISHRRPHQQIAQRLSKTCKTVQVRRHACRQHGIFVVVCRYPIRQTQCRKTGGGKAGGDRRPWAGNDRDAHCDRIKCGHAAAVRKWIQCDIDQLVSLHMRIAIGIAQNRQSIICNTFTVEYRADALLVGRIAERGAFQDEAGRWQGAQHARPKPKHRIGKLRGQLKEPNVTRPAASAGSGPGSGSGSGAQKPRKQGKSITSSTKRESMLGGTRTGLREGSPSWRARPRRLAPAGHLHRDRLLGKDLEPVSNHVPDKIDEDIYLVRSDHRGQFRIGQGGGRSPRIHAAAQAAR